MYEQFGKWKQTESWPIKNFGGHLSSPKLFSQFQHSQLSASLTFSWLLHGNGTGQWCRPNTCPLLSPKKNRATDYVFCRIVDRRFSKSLKLWNVLSGMARCLHLLPPSGLLKQLSENKIFSFLSCLAVFSKPLSSFFLFPFSSFS